MGSHARVLMLQRLIGEGRIGVRRGWSDGAAVENAGSVVPVSLSEDYRNPPFSRFGGQPYGSVAFELLGLGSRGL